MSTFNFKSLIYQKKAIPHINSHHFTQTNQRTDDYLVLVLEAHLRNFTKHRAFAYKTNKSRESISTRRRAISRRKYLQKFSYLFDSFPPTPLHRSQISPLSVPFHNPSPKTHKFPVFLRQSLSLDLQFPPFSPISDNPSPRKIRSLADF